MIDFEKRLPVIDLHTCIQGEGKNAGIPHFLIRLTGCNLNCMFSDYTCDTAYASWVPEKGKYTFEDIRALMRNNPEIDHALITGGEPTIHTRLLPTLLYWLYTSNISTSIETNGTIFLPEALPFLNLVTMSPKLSNSVPIVGKHALNEYVDKIVTQEDVARHEENRANIDSMKKWMESAKNYQFKFVVTTEEQMQEVDHFKEMLSIPRHKIYLMPEGVTNEQLQKRRRWVMETCIRKGYNYTDRLHIIAYDNKRIA